MRLEAGGWRLGHTRDTGTHLRRVEDTENTVDTERDE
jgi:hypothetical protein